MVRTNPVDIDLYERGAVVRFAGVDAGYGAATVLAGIEFEARAGEVSLVTGPAAAGKTTFTHLLRLALEPRSGRAVMLGRRHRPRQRAGQSEFEEAHRLCR